MPNTAQQVYELVDAIKATVAIAEKNPPNDVNILTISLVLKTELTESGGGAIDLRVIAIPITIGGSVKNVFAQTIKVDFEVVPRYEAGLDQESKEKISDSLMQAINTVKIAVKNARQPIPDTNIPLLSLKEAEVTLQFILEENGNLKFASLDELVDFGPSGSSQFTHSITLKLGKRPN